MLTSLVTGGADFVGAHVTNDLVNMGHHVVVLDDLSGGFQDNVNPQATFVEGSITDVDLIQRLFEERGFDYVYHLAAYAAEGLSHFIRRLQLREQPHREHQPHQREHQARRRVFRLHILDRSLWCPSSPLCGRISIRTRRTLTGVAKLAVEQDLRAAHDMFGLDCVVFRPHNVYGEYQNLGDRYRNVVGIFMKQLMQGAPLTVFGDGNQTRAFSYIGDISFLMANAVNVPEAFGEVFNVGADQEYTVNELAETVMDAIGIRGELRHLEARNEVVHAFADHSKARRVFGVQSDTSLIDGLRKMATWARQAGIRRSTKFENLELTKSLPSIWTEE